MLITLISCVSLVLTSCSSVRVIQDQPVSTATLIKERRVERNYELGKEISGYAGESVVQRREFEFTKTEVVTTGLVAANDFTMRYPPFGHLAHVVAGTRVEFVGTTERNGKTFKLVRLPGGVNGVGLLVDESGAFEGRGVSLLLKNSRMGYTYTVSPATTRLSERVDVNANSQALRRIELVFVGANKEQARFRLQEFTRENPTRPKRNEEFALSRAATSLNIEGYVLRIVKADDERISFVVLSEPAID